MKCSTTLECTTVGSRSVWKCCYYFNIVHFGALQVQGVANHLLYLSLQVSLGSGHDVVAVGDLGPAAATAAAAATDAAAAAAGDGGDGGRSEVVLGARGGDALLACVCGGGGGGRLRSGSG